MIVQDHLIDKGDGHYSLEAVIGGIHCMSCVRRIEQKLHSLPEITQARVNMTSSRLSMTWSGTPEMGEDLIKTVEDLGFDAKPYVADALEISTHQEAKFLLKAMGISGFAMCSIMLLSFAVWSNVDGDVGPGTLHFLHWISALIALPAIAYAGRPFFKSALKALSNAQTNMDVPISLALILATSLSLFELISDSKGDLYFDSAVMLMFFLLMGRYLNVRARGRAKSAAQDLLMLMAGDATYIEDGKQKTVSYRDIAEGMLLQVAVGETIAADGVVEEGVSSLDTSMLTGETLPKDVNAKQTVLAGMVNLSHPLKIRVTNPNDKSLFQDIIRLMEKAEQGGAKYIQLSDKVAKLYTPLVHSLSLLTFLLWYFVMDVGFHQAIVYAISVLIITCPCALGLAIPVVQVLASGRLFKKGILIKTGDALEKLSQITLAFFDKTGTLTLGQLQLLQPEKIKAKDFQLAASMAAQSQHPLSRSITKAYKGKLLKITVEDIPGCGLSARYKGKEIKLGKAKWAVNKTSDNENKNITLWLSEDGKERHCFTFQDVLREDSRDTVMHFKNQGIASQILSGDRPIIVQGIAKELSIKEYHAGILPDQKCSLIEKATKTGQKVLMVGDGLNDAPALTLAHVSISPATAMGITQNAADIVFQGDKLLSVAEAYETAKASAHLTKTNLGLAVLYNIVAIPLAVSGFVTPMVAAIAMSLSSITVVLNSLRLNYIVNRKI